MTTKNLQTAQEIQNNEFYTRLSDIENELKHYTQYFQNKIVYCNCDDPKYSNFYRYFVNNFELLKLQLLLCTHYQSHQQNLFGSKTIMPATCTAITEPHKKETHHLFGDGDFRSTECQTILDTADIIVTNPPFSLFRSYIAQLIKHKKKFLILGTINNCSYKHVFPLFQQNKIRCGLYSGKMTFDHDNNTQTTLGNICWFTNLNITKQNKHIDCTEKYDSKKYPKYDKYDAININNLKEIPFDYPGLMGVPLTILAKYNPDQFEIIDLIPKRDLYIEGQGVFQRIAIRHKHI